MHSITWNTYYRVKIKLMIPDSNMLWLLGSLVSEGNEWQNNEPLTNVPTLQYG